MSDDNKKKMDEAWDQAFAQSGVHIPIGRLVICDSCNEDWTDRPETGGLLFGSYAVCPDCQPEWEKNIKASKEEAYIHGFCPKDKSFGDWVRNMRGPDAGISVTVGGKR
jgi:hypothetical protein